MTDRWQSDVQKGNEETEKRRNLDPTHKGRNPETVNLPLHSVSGDSKKLKFIDRRIGKSSIFYQKHVLSKEVTELSLTRTEFFLV